MIGAGKWDVKLQVVSSVAIKNSSLREHGKPLTLTRSTMLYASAMSVATVGGTLKCGSHNIEHAAKAKRYKRDRQQNASLIGFLENVCTPATVLKDGSIVPHQVPASLTASVPVPPLAPTMSKLALTQATSCFSCSATGPMKDALNMVVSEKAPVSYRRRMKA